jgi:hypothetical protein
LTHPQNASFQIDVLPTSQDLADPQSRQHNQPRDRTRWFRQIASSQMARTNCSPHTV